MGTRKQRISLAAFCCYALSVALYVGSFLRVLPSLVPDYTEILLSSLCVSCYGLFLFGLAQTQRRRKLLVLALVLLGVLRWIRYYILAGDLLYALMSFPADLYAEAVLIALLLSTKRGPILRIVTVCVLSLRLVETSLNLFAESGLFDPQMWGNDSVSFWALLLRTLRFVEPLMRPKLLQFAALFMLPAILRLPKKEEAEDERILDESFFSRLEQGKFEVLCLDCGQKLSQSGACSACGKEQKMDRELLDSFPWPESMKLACESLKLGDWNGATEAFEASLERVEEKTFAYLGLMLAQLQYADFGELWERPVRLEMQPYWQDATNHAEGEVKTKLIRMRRMVFNLYEEKREEKAYNHAQELCNAEDVETILEGAKAFYCVGDYEDAPTRAMETLDVAAQRLFDRAWDLEQAGEYEEAVRIYERLPRHREARARLAACREALRKRSSSLYLCGTGGKIALLLGSLALAAVAYFGF